MHGISLLIHMARICSSANGLFTLMRKFTLKRTSPNNHFCMNRKASEYLTTMSLTVSTQKTL